MTDFCHYLAKNHARKNSIKQKYSSGPRTQSRQAPWRCATVWSFAGIPTRQVMFSAINIIISMDIDDDMMDDAVSQNSTIGWFEYFCWFEYFLNALNIFWMHGRWFLVFTSPKAWHDNQPKDHNFHSVLASSSSIHLVTTNNNIQPCQLYHHHLILPVVTPIYSVNTMNWWWLSWWTGKPNNNFVSSIRWNTIIIWSGS